DVPDEGTRPDGAAGSGAGSSAGSASSASDGTNGQPGDRAIAAPFHHDDIVVTTEGERSSKNIAILASIAGAAVVFGGVGLYFNLDAKSASDEVSAHRPMSVPWTPQRQATYDRANDSTTKAEIFYGV